MTSIYLKDGKVLTKNGQLVADKNCCCDECKEECYGACINKENAVQCYERVNGVIQEAPCPPCGDECYYNSTSTPGYSYVCLPTKTQEECEALTNVDGNPSIFLGCGSLQKECYYNECNGLWFPLPGSSKGDQYHVGGCDNFVSNNCASEFCVEGCGSPCCCYRCVRNGEVDCQYTTKESCEECNQIHTCYEKIQTQCDGDCPEGTTPAGDQPTLEIRGQTDGCYWWSMATASVTVGCGVILSATLTEDGFWPGGYGFARIGRVSPTVTAEVGSEGTGAELDVTLEQYQDGCGFDYWRVASVAVTAAGSGYGTGDPVVFTTASGDTQNANAYGYVEANEDGAVTAIIVTSQGEYYREDSSAPAYVEKISVKVIGGGSGSGANITATVDTDPNSPKFGQVTGLTVANGGSGYVSLCERARPVDSCSECPPLQSPESAICQSTKVDDGTKPCGTWTGGFPCNDTPCDEAQP